MICPQHDTHVENCANEMHNVSDNWEIRIPVRCDSENILLLAMGIEELLKLQFPRRAEFLPINIGVQERR